MIEHLINTVKSAFDNVLGLVTGVFGGTFDAISDLSSNVF